MNFFKRLDLPTNFLKSHPSTWPTNSEYQNNLKLVTKLKSVNDVTERGVKLTEDYNRLLCKSEEQQQFVLQVVSDYVKIFPDTKKESLGKPM